MKPIRENSKPISSDTGLLAIKALAEENNFPPVEISERGDYQTLSTLIPTWIICLVILMLRTSVP